MAPRELSAAQLFGPMRSLGTGPHVPLAKVVEALRGRIDFVERDHLYRLTPGFGGRLEYDPSGVSPLGRIQLAPARGAESTTDSQPPRPRSLVVGDKLLSREVRVHDGVPYVPLLDLAKAMGRRLQSGAGGFLLVLEEGPGGAPSPVRPMLRLQVFDRPIPESRR